MKCDTICGGSPGVGNGPLFVSGEVEFGSATAPAVFVFTETATESHPIPVGELNPDSNLFASPSPGVLEYVGTAPLRFRVSYSLAFDWRVSDFGTVDAFTTALLLNGARVDKTIQFQVLDKATGEELFAKTADTLLTLQPGDRLQIGISTLGTGAARTIDISSLTIVATRS